MRSQLNYSFHFNELRRMKEWINSNCSGFSPNCIDFRAIKFRNQQPYFPSGPWLEIGKQPFCFRESVIMFGAGDIEFVHQTTLYAEGRMGDFQRLHLLSVYMRLSSSVLYTINLGSAKACIQAST